MKTGVDTSKASIMQSVKTQAIHLLKIILSVRQGLSIKTFRPHTFLTAPVGLCTATEQTDRTKFFKNYRAGTTFQEVGENSRDCHRDENGLKKPQYVAGEDDRPHGDGPHENDEKRAQAAPDQLALEWGGVGRVK